MSQQIQTYAITAPGFYGLNTQDSSLDLASGFALTANNCVIDQYGRVGARKGWSKINSANTDLGTSDIKMVTELIGDDGTSTILCAGNNKLFKLSGSTLVTLTNTNAATITDSNWQAAFVNSLIVFYQLGHTPLIYDPATSTTAFYKISSFTGYTGIVQQSNCVISAYGRTWSANTTTDKQTIQFSDLNSPFKFTGGSSGTLDTHSVWPKGTDNIVALGAHNGFLFIFGYNNILIYQGATNPSTMTLSDVITGIGCIARDSVANTGTDIIFLSSTGVRSVMRTIQEKSAPLNDLSKNVRNDLISAVKSENLTTVKSIYSPLDGFYLLTLPVLQTVYCFDTKAYLQDGSARVTTWDSITPKSFVRKADGTLVLGKSGYLANYTGYQDDSSSYRFQYFTNHTDLGTPSVTSILKKLSIVVIGGSNQYVTMKWGYDFTGNYYAQNVKIPTQSVAEYGVAEYGSNGSPVAYYSAGLALQTLISYPTGSGKVIQTGYEADINGSPLSIQKIEIHAKNGKVV